MATYSPQDKTRAKRWRATWTDEYRLEHNKRNAQRYHKMKSDPSYQRKKMWEGAKSRAKRESIPFDITIDDIIIPSVCPVLGIPIFMAEGKGPGPNSPSLDKLHPELGYVKGNIHVISWRANTLKKDGTISELRSLVEWMEKSSSCSKSHEPEISKTEDCASSIGQSSQPVEG